MVTDKFLPGVPRGARGGFVTSQEVTVKVDGIDGRRVWLNNGAIALLVSFELLGCRAFCGDIDAGAHDPHNGAVLISNRREGGAPVAGAAWQIELFVIFHCLCSLNAVAVIGT